MKYGIAMLLLSQTALAQSPFDIVGGVSDHSKKTAPSWFTVPEVPKVVRNRSLVIIGSEDCGPCRVLKRQFLGSDQIRFETFPNLEAAGRAGYAVLPRIKLYEGGELKRILDGGTATPERIRDWLSETTLSHIGASNVKQSK